MSIMKNGSNQLLCMDPHCPSVSSCKDVNKENENYIEDRLWRKKGSCVLKRWKREHIVMRREINGMELFSHESDSFTIMALRAEVKPLCYQAGLSGKYKNIRIGFQVRFEQRIHESDIDSVYSEKNEDIRTHWSKWYEFRTNDLFSMVRWVTTLDPTINSYGLRETLLGFHCSEACCDGSGPETWLCKWDEIHPSMLDVQSQYIRAASDDKSSSNKHKSRRSSRAYSRGRAFSVNEAGIMNKGLSSTSSVNIHDNFTRPPDSPEVQPPRYSDVVGRTSICTAVTPEELAQEKFQEFSAPANTFIDVKEEWSRREEDDTFLPPYGPARMVPLNMGIGEEIGLPPNIQKMYDPEKKKIIYVDHIAKRITLQAPEDKSQRKLNIVENLSTSRISSGVDRLSSFIPDCQRLSTRRMTSISTGTNSSNADMSPGDDRWLPCFLESQMSAPCGAQGENIEKVLGSGSGLLPQIQENSDNKDYRIKILRPIVTLDTKASHSWLNMADIMDVITAEHIAQQAFSKPVAVLIDCSGSNGQAGWNGEVGKNGCNGSNGRNCMGEGNKGENGHHGIDGYSGHNGGNGEDAGNGQDVEIWLSVEEHDSKLYLKISGAVDTLVDMEGERIVFVSCKGGQGGNGGSGGNGGNGGHGGDGGNGGQGLDGDGGAGGNGGNGGSAGFGGNGGRAGNGGNGGIVTIHSSDPRLFMLIECDIRGGTSGNPGVAGKPGVPGKGGKGGSGGKGAYFTSYRNRAAGLDTVNMTSMHQRNALIYNGGMASPGSGMFTGNYDFNDQRDHNMDSGKSGMPMTVTYVGKDGPTGFHGKPGLEADSGLVSEEGCWGIPGCIRWIITNKSAEESSTPELNEVFFFKYNVEVLGFEVFSDNDDGIMEPNEPITISNVKLVNTGQMTLPKGAILTFPSTKTMRSFPNQYVSLPQILVNEVYEVKDVFKACIHDVTAPNAPGPFFSHVDVESRVTLLNREFLDAGNVQNFSVQYPISLSNIETPKQMGRGEESILKIELSNCSSIIYGTKPGTQVIPETNVELKIRLDRRLLISGIKTAESSLVALPIAQMHVKPNRKNGVSIVVSEIPNRNGKLEVALTLVMENRAELFDNTLIQVELYLRNRLIEYDQSKVRVAPYYHALGEPGDALFITGPDTTRASFLRWEFLLNSLGMMNIDFWDIERYKGLSFLQNSGSRHEVTWIDRYRGKMIIFPHYEPHQISGWDICCHFGLRVDDVLDESAFPIEVLEASDDQAEKTESLDSTDPEMETVADEHDSSIILITDSCDQEMDKAILLGCLAVLRVHEKMFRYGGYHFFNPAGACYKLEVADRKFKEMISKLRRIFPNQACISYDRTINYEMMSNLYWSYGEINIRRLGLERDSMLTLFCTGADQRLDIACHPSVFDWVPIISQWAQVYLVMLAALGTARRSCIIRLNPAKPVFMLPWGDTISIQKCAALSLEPYLDNELFHNMKNCWRFRYICKDIATNPSNYQGEIPLLLFTLWKYRKRFTNLCNDKQLRKEVNGLITTVQRVLRDYYGDRNTKMWNIEAHIMMREQPKLKFSDLVDPKYSFHPTRLNEESDFTDLSKYLTANEYQVIESINSLSQ